MDHKIKSISENNETHLSALLAPPTEDMILIPNTKEKRSIPNAYMNIWSIIA